ncbi:MAG TPA: hypothetical protein VIK91_00520, partial [Nannocystis sp.]
MDIAKLQTWAKDNFVAALDPLSTEYGVARLLVQTGQLADAGCKSATSTRSSPTSSSSCSPSPTAPASTSTRPSPGP